MNVSDDQIREAIGQLLVVGFHGADEEPPEAIAEALSTGKIGGVILFRRNVDTVEQVCALNTRVHELAAEAPEAPFVAVDQEGGRVVRLKEPLTPIPPMRAVGDTNDGRLISEVSEVIATEVGALGFNLNFAPVLDVDTNPLNPIIGDRAFGRTPERVIRAAGAFLLGHHTAGVIPCGKHFPGHGDTLLDSHKDLPTLKHDMERLQRVELEPFRRAIGADIPMLMTAHMLLPALDSEHPATLSQAVIGELLREELGYDGVVITDDLEMKAVAERYDIDEMVTLGLRAGIDIFLICHTEAKWQQAYDTLYELATSGDEDLQLVLRAAERVRRLKRTMLGNQRRPWQPYDGWREMLGCDEHRQTMARVEWNPEEKLVDPTEAG
ncbi:beta-N-acetylhexosaminidase [Persicimonas caeni]|uniref:Beta-N-acetylhexosaminidase n=1 Tax=Persicimonas caeni TaxID=2292766 RepID=A0A4Y6PPW0_PERCE|nr:beta-N-acetylhexosaminidase [Persicimonas caeni]QDG50037.1 beta-N-acetylhexosaminidase [Persicimonas caeni]QED31258.1 beta-N-acetylhexosaminidase [Persicimonas caeni]